MRIQFISLAHCIVLLCAVASAQRAQTNGLNDRQVPHHPLMGTKTSQETPRGLLKLPTQDRLQPGSLRASRTGLPFPDERFIVDGTQRILGPLRRMSAPQSQISVIDTAIVRMESAWSGRGVLPGDTTRHLYSFNASAKRTSDVTQKLIGDLWVDTLRHTNTYDASNDILSDLYEYWENGQWVNNRRYTYTYDAGNNILLYLDQSWSKGLWVNNQIYTYMYDAKGNLISMLTEYWYGPNHYSYRSTYSYDTDGNMLSELQEDCLNGQCVNNQRYTYTRNSYGNVLSSLDELWSNDHWMNYERLTYTYDANGNTLSYLIESWSGGQWVNSQRATYTYDGNGHKLSELWEVSSNGQLLNLIRYTNAYDANGNQTSYDREDWQEGHWVVTENWTATFDANNHLLSFLLGGRRQTYTYDANGNLLSRLEEIESNGQWVNQSRLTYFYDGNGNVTSVWHHSWLNSAWIPTDIPGMEGNGVFTVTDSAGNDYPYHGYNFTFARRLIVTGVQSQSENVPAVYSLSQNYPNPFNPTTNFEFRIPKSEFVSLKVYDILGREVATLVNEVKQPGGYTVQWDASRQSSGVYFYRLQAGSFVNVKKLILLR